MDGAPAVLCGSSLQLSTAKMTNNRQSTARHGMARHSTAQGSRIKPDSYALYVPVLCCAVPEASTYVRQPKQVLCSRHCAKDTLLSNPVQSLILPDAHVLSNCMQCSHQAGKACKQQRAQQDDREELVGLQAASKHEDHEDRSQQVHDKNRSRAQAASRQEMQCLYEREELVGSRAATRHIVQHSQQPQGH